VAVKVLLDTSYALRGSSGTAVYVERLQAALGELNVAVVPVADARRPAPAGGGWRSVRNHARDRWWLQVALPRLAVEHGADVVHHPLPATFRPRGAATAIAQVITVHDLAFEALPDCFDPRWARWASTHHRAAALAADAVVAVSRSTAREMRERWDVPGERIVVAPHGPGQWQAREIRHGATVRSPSVPLSRPYLLYVGDDEPRKDLPTLRAAHARLRERMGEAAPDLVLAGRIRDPERTPPPGPGERRVEDPDRDALLALMDGALALVHPALHEGVGLTPLEAMARGVPVVVARSPALDETCRDAEALAGVLEALAGDVRRREALALAGRRVAGDRSWTLAARRHVEAYTLARDRAKRRERADPAPAGPRAERAPTAS
jgi:glycosyltransferase involved in cell wall biosynthesis